MIITQESITTGIYLFLVMAGVITTGGALFVYFVKKSKVKKTKK